MRPLPLNRGAFLLTALTVLTLSYASALRAQDYDPDKAQKKEAERAKKEHEKAEKEVKKQREKSEKEAQKRRAEAEKKKEAKVPVVPAAPSLSVKTGDPVRDYVADFETAYAGSTVLFEVDPYTKHDYEACGAQAMAICKAAHGIARMHDERVRQYGNDYHHQLESLANTAKKLSDAVRGHHRDDIFATWAQLKLERDALALSSAWRPE